MGERVQPMPGLKRSQGSGWKAMMQTHTGAAWQVRCQKKCSVKCEFQNNKEILSISLPQICRGIYFY